MKDTPGYAQEPNGPELMRYPAVNIVGMGIGWALVQDKSDHPPVERRVMMVQLFAPDAKQHFMLTLDADDLAAIAEMGEAYRRGMS